MNARFPPPLIQSCLGQHGNYTRWFLDQGNFEQGVGRGFTFCVQGRREQGAVRKQMELSQQFCSGLQHFYIFQLMLFFPVKFVYRFCQDHLKFFWYVTNIKVYERCENSSQSKDWRLFSAPVVVFVLFDKSISQMTKMCFYFGGARSKGFVTLRNVLKLIFLGQDWARKVCRFSVLFGCLTK